MAEPTAGVFRVVRAAVLDVENGCHRIRLSGVVTAPGLPERPAVETWTFHAGDDLPVGGTEYPATVDRARPEVFTVHITPPAESPAGLLARRASAERLARADRLGIDAGAVPGEDAAPRGFREALARAARSSMGDPERLPDGRLPVSVAEAEKLGRSGEAATAVITAIDYLRLPAGSLPSREASLADVALEVRRADGTSYRAVSRFGFGTAARREQIGFPGAQVPVRLDPADPSRVALDRRRLPPLPR